MYGLLHIIFLSIENEASNLAEKYITIIFAVKSDLVHVLHLQEQMEVVKDKGDEALYDKLDSAYPTDDDDTEVYIIYYFIL